MIATQDVVIGPSPVTAAPVREPAPTGATPPRNFFDGCSTLQVLPRYEHPAGPANPFPNRWTLAMAVEQIARAAA